VFLSHSVLDKAFKGLRKIFPQDAGKTRLERVSALRLFIASAKLMNDKGLQQLDLKVGSALREELVAEVGRVVELNGTKFYTKDFATQFGNESDFALGSNFLTTRLKASEGRKIAYPGRPKPIIDLDDWKLSHVENSSEIILKDFNLAAIRTELIVWLLRNENFDFETAEPSAEQVSKALITRVASVYGKSISDVLKITEADLADFLKVPDLHILDSKVADLSDLIPPEPSFVAASKSEESRTVLPESDVVLSAVRDALNQKGECNFLFFGAPGTGKTWYASEVAKALADGEEHRVKLLQFHPSVSYDDFVEGFVPTIDAKTKSVAYEIQAKHFVEFSTLAAQNSEKTYVLVIDEISRGDPARVFGELLTYIEPDYRGREFSLIYSKKLFSVPDNLVILATANPYDRSVSELDDAFLRRFFMLEFKSDKKLLEQRLRDNTLVDGDIQKILHFFDTIDSNLQYGFGHAQLFRVFSINDMITLWRSKLKFIVERSLKFDMDKFHQIEAKFDQLFSSDATVKIPNATVAVEAAAAN
jgi:MoxR-like ATPase